MEGRYFHTWLTGLLLVFLVPPFLLVQYDRNLEPYPAVLFPDQGGKAGIRDNKCIVIKIEWSARHISNGEWKHVDTKELLDPVPIYYALPLLKLFLSYENFHLGGATPRGNRGKITPQEIAKTKEWFAQRLLQLGYSPDELRFSLNRLIYDLETKQPILRNTQFEQILELD